jgi:hypothetical protein
MSLQRRLELGETITQGEDKADRSTTFMLLCEGSLNNSYLTNATAAPAMGHGYWLGCLPAAACI